jgi:transcriptional regulator with XRE-family HTH domain
MDIRQARNAVHMSQAALAARSGIDRTRLSFAENGYTQLTAQEEANIQQVIIAEIARQKTVQGSVLQQMGDSPIGQSQSEATGSRRRGGRTVNLEAEENRASVPTVVNAHAKGGRR